MIIEQSKQIISEINRAFIGKNEVIEKVLMTIYAGGHVLLEDCPGVGKTTLAVAFSRVLGLSTRRIQFTPDTLPSDITGFTMWNRRTSEFEYREGAANCQLLLADGKRRKAARPKAKKLRHVCLLPQEFDHPVIQKLQQGTPVSDRELRQALAAFKGGITFG